MIRRLFFMVSVLLALSSCQQYNIEEILTSRNDISLTIKGDLQMSFNENRCQLGYNTERNEFRVYDETFADWFILRCSAKPTSEGQEIAATLEYTTAKNTQTIKGLNLKVHKVSSEGLVWLWDDDKAIGIVVKTL